jgi:pyridoxamine 5'-phosphate oxidase
VAVLSKVDAFMFFEPGALRRDYQLGTLDESTVDPDPFNQFQAWLTAAIAADLIEANAMIVATAASDGTPSVRTVLLKDFSHNGFVFTTSYDSQKGQELATNPDTALLFYWPALERQVRITGTATRITSQESEEFFSRRPVESRISAAISPQSKVIPNRAWLEEKTREVRASLGDQPPARPESWGGYRITPRHFEFWQGRRDRLHDRVSYRLEDSSWIIERLAP